MSAVTYTDADLDSEWSPEPAGPRWPRVDSWPSEARDAYTDGLELPTETERLRAYLARLRPGTKREWAWWCAWSACTGDAMPAAPAWPDWVSKDSPEKVARKVSALGRDLRPVSPFSEGADVARERAGDRRYRARGHAW